MGSVSSDDQDSINYLHLPTSLRDNCFKTLFSDCPTSIHLCAWTILFPCSNLFLAYSIRPSVRQRAPILIRGRCTYRKISVYHPPGGLLNFGGSRGGLIKMGAFEEGLEKKFLTLEHVKLEIRNIAMAHIH